MLFLRSGEDHYQQVRLPSDEDDCDVDDSDGGDGGVDDDDDCSGGGGGGYQQVRLPTDAKTAVTYFGGRVQMLVILAPLSLLIALLCFGVALLCLFVCLFIMVCDCGLAVVPFHLLCFQPVLHVDLVERNKES